MSAETNLNTEIHAELNEKAEALLVAADEFWKVHRKIGGPRAVVWLTGQDAALVVFTRGEYKSQIMRNIDPLVEETPLGDNDNIDSET